MKRAASSDAALSAHLLHEPGRAPGFFSSASRWSWLRAIRHPRFEAVAAYGNGLALAVPFEFFRDQIARTKMHRITFEVPEHLVAAFSETAKDFFEKAHSGATNAQRAAEIRASDRDAGLDSLAYLLRVAEGPSDDAGVIARFLVGLYNGYDFPFALTTLRQLDDELFEHCLAVLRLDNSASAEVHDYFPNGAVRWQTMIKNWNLAKKPAQEFLPTEDHVHHCSYENLTDAPGYRDATLFFKVAAEGEAPQSFGLALSAEDSKKIARDLVGLHRRAWQRGKPIDVAASESRPDWL
jgi:hypothetical protein